MKNLIFTFVLQLTLVACVFAQQGNINNAGHSGNHSSHEKNGNTALGPTYNGTVCGLNYTQATSLITTRNDPYTINNIYGHGLPDTLTISNLPSTLGCGFDIIHAYLYWAESYLSGTSDTQSVNITNPLSNTTTINGTLAGTSGPVCWGEIGTYTFRADLTNFITGNGNYIINNFSGVSDPIWEVAGASLIIIYKDKNATYEGTLVLYDGCDAIDGGGIDVTMSGFNVCQTPILGRGFVLSTDFEDNVGPHTMIINNINDTFPSSSINFDDTTASYTVGQTIAVMGAISYPDCYYFSLAGVYYQTACNSCLATSLYTSFNLYPDTSQLHHYFITDSISGIPPYHYLWTWGDGNQDTIANPSHTYADTGIYTICLTITDSTGCQSTYCDSSYNVQRTSNMMAYINVIPNIMTGTKTNDSKNEINVYPNPATNYLTIRQSSPSSNQQLYITDILGNEVYHQPINNSNNQSIDISQWSDGVYFYQLKNNMETVRGKFVKE